MEKPGVGMEPFSVGRGYRVDDKVIMDMGSLVQMGGNHHLETVSPQFVCQLQTNLMGLLWRDPPVAKD